MAASFNYGQRYAARITGNYPVGGGIFLKYQFLWKIGPSSFTKFIEVALGIILEERVSF
jgi:hypothetical protein